MANFKKELKGVIARFDAAQEAFMADADKAEKQKKKLKKAKATIKSLQQQVASLEQELKVARDSAKSSTTETSTKPAAAKAPKAKKSSKTTKSTGARSGRKKKPAAPAAPAATEPAVEETTAVEMAEAVSDAPDTVSEAAAEKTATPKPRRGRPSKAAAAKTSSSRGTKKAATAKAKPARSKASGDKPKTTRRRGRPSTKPAPSVLTQINGVGATMAKRFEEAGITTINQFAKLSDNKMKEVLEQCGPRYRNADAEKMESYRANARAAMA